ncbi:MAG: hypothetical protein IT546_10665 [Caulobacteraceae bacterium]|nr:hypothetical protein [Caulobacteraceae bacterium]
MAALAFASLARAAEPAHYDIKASFGQDAALKAEVEIRLPPEEVGTETAFLIGERFTLRQASAPGATVSTELTDKPIGGLRKVTFKFAKAPTKPIKLKFAYDGPLNNPDTDNSGTPWLGPDLLELRLETMWIPVRTDISLQYAVDADLKGVPADFTLVFPGDIRRSGDRVRLHRTLPDVDTPMVALRHAATAKGPGVVFAGPDDDPLVETYRGHATAAAAWLQGWLGPLPFGDVRIVVVPRKGGSSYARRNYTVISRPSAEDPDKAGNPNYGRLIGHEFAHAWWSVAGPQTEDYWLVESLAEYSAGRYVEHFAGAEGYKKVIDAKIERAKGSGPVMPGKRPTREALYQRGPLLLIDLEHRIGRAKMDDMLRALAKDPPRHTSQLLAELERVAGADEAKAFAARLRAVDMPVVQLYAEAPASTVAAASSMESESRR